MQETRGFVLSGLPSTHHEKHCVETLRSAALRSLVWAAPWRLLLVLQIQEENLRTL